MSNRCQWSRKSEESCPFEEEGAELFVTSDENTYCRFHMPLNSSIRGIGAKKRWNKDHLDKFTNELANHVASKIAKSQSLDFRNVSFPEELDFSSLIGDGQQVPNASFEEVEFQHGANFRDVHFGGDVNFSNSNFEELADFRGTSFHGAARFNNTKVPHGANFSEGSSHTCFMKGAAFEHANFGQEANFAKTFFATHCDFMHSRFEQADFTEATFPSDGEGNFFSCHFQNGVFNHAMFGEGGARFSDCIFFVGAYFNEITSVGTFSFEGGNDGRNCWYQFADAKFMGRASFVGREFTSRTDFSGTQFHGVPSFIGCNIHRPVDLSNANFTYSGHDATDAYRWLRHRMEERRDREQEGKFFILEKRSQRYDPSIDRIDKFLSWLYDITSVYGQSIVRPIVSLLITILVFSIMYGAVVRFSEPLFFALSSSQNPVATFLNLFSFSFEQTFRPFEIWSPRYANVVRANGDLLISKTIECCGLLLRMLSSLQTVFTLAFAAEFLVALRWRFRRG